MGTETKRGPIIETTQAFKRAMEEMKTGIFKLGHQTMRTSHLVLGLVGTEGVNQPLINLGATPKRVLEVLRRPKFQKPDKYPNRVIQVMQICAQLARERSTPIMATYIAESLFVRLRGEHYTVLHILKINPDLLIYENVLQRMKEIELEQMRQPKIS